MKWCHCGDDQKGQTNGVGFAGFGPKCEGCVIMISNSHLIWISNTQSIWL
jgi:hypothetical protein